MKEDLKQETVIRYLKQEEKNRTKVLYETCFPEDSPAFVDYYYTHRVLDNRILVMEQEGGASLPKVMVHLNPYRFSVCGQETEAPYLVAVAADQAVRRQGKMSMVLSKALRDMALEQSPFAFLIPANPRVYRSSGFVFVSTEQYSRYGTRQEGPLILVKNSREKEPDLQAAELEQKDRVLDTRKPAASKTLIRKERMFFMKKAAAADIPEIAAFSDHLLEQEYDVSLRKTRADYKRMLAELACEDGGILLLMETSAGQNEEGSRKLSVLRGVLSYGKADDALELKDLLVPLADWEIARQLLAMHFPHEKIVIPEMKFMVRILNLQALVPLLKSNRDISRRIRVKDPLISANQGSFWIRVGREGGSIVPIPEEAAEETAEIGELAEQLFEDLKICIREWV